MKIETIAAQAGHGVDPATGAVAPPIHMSTTFQRDPDGSYPRGYVYARTDNPNRRALEQCMVRLEGGAAAAAFSSGAAAAAAVFQSLSPADHVLAPSDCYHGTSRLLREVFQPWGLEVTFADLTDIDELKQAIRPNTKLLWVETPSNPLLKITDIAGVSSIAHEIGALCVCDNTWATPVLQRPLESDADIVVHSTTKYLGGHSDVMGGVVVARTEDDFFGRVRNVQANYGAVPSPFDCWLVVRGIRTLHLRMRAHSENALELAQFLNQHPRVQAVHYPGLAAEAGLDLAQRQMSAYGGMLSFEVKGAREQAMAVVAKVGLFTRATSLGGTESLIEHRASVEGPESATPDNLLRVSVGLENVGDLIEDLAQALE